MPKTETLMREVKHLLVDLDMLKKGHTDSLANLMGVHRSTINMAIGGYRDTPRYQNLLIELKAKLEQIKIFRSIHHTTGFK